MMPMSDATVEVVRVAAAERSGSSLSDSTDCSNCANKIKLRTQAGVRVSIDLRQFFSDQRARAFMWAPYGRCVQWLTRRVARIFNLSNDIALMSRGHILPTIEPLVMLESDDTVEVVNMSYVLSHNKQDDTNVTSRRTPKGSCTLAGKVEKNIDTIPYSLAVKQENISGLTTSSHSDNLAEHRTVNLIEDMEVAGGTLESGNIDENEDLQRLKQRALRLLDEHCHMLQEASAPKRLRRRRRRRKLPAATDVLDTSYDEEVRSSHVASHDAGDAVLRNGSGSRPPRVVRVLSPSPVLQHVL